jgi:MoxR-like ATPase
MQGNPLGSFGKWKTSSTIPRYHLNEEAQPKAPSSKEANLDLTSIDSLQSAMRERKYIAERGLATSLYLALKLGRPVFLEGEAGVGKTEVAKILAALLDTDLIRLQCYEGLDVHHAVYEWNYTRQMMHIRLLEARGDRASEAELFGPEFLLRRPLLQAIEQSKAKPACC